MMTNLIYDRTLEDVAEVRRLLAKLDPETGDGLTAAEQAKWDAGLKGAYNFTDLNRVEAAVKTLASALTSAGYPVEVTPVLKRDSRLPSGYTEVEWIQSSGTQYIDTGVVPDGETSVDVSFLVTDLPSAISGIRPVYGAAADYNSNAFEFWALDGGFATYGTQAYKSNLGAVANAIQTVSQDKNILTVSGTESAFTKQTFTAPYTMLLFATHRNGGIHICEAAANLRIYSFAIKSGAVHKNFVPCKNPDGVVGLYDLVGGEFYTTPTAAEAVALPAGYTQVEYLQSSGTQYIDTGFKPNQNTAIMIDLDLDGSFSQYCSPFGARTGSTAQFWAFTNKGNTTWAARYATTEKSVSKAITGRRSISLNKNTFSVDEASATFASASFQSQYNMWIFATNSSGTAQYLCKAKIYSAQIYDDGVLIRNFVPARNASGALGLYDTVNGAFYTNAGSGAFAAGADIVGFTAGADVSPYEDREWQEGDIVRRAQWTTCLDNVQRLRDAYYTLAETGELPKPEDKLDYTGANTIEKILADIDLLIDCMKSSYRRCGTFRAGNNAAHLPLKGSI